MKRFIALKKDSPFEGVQVCEAHYVLNVTREQPLEVSAEDWPVVSVLLFGSDAGKFLEEVKQQEETEA